MKRLYLVAALAALCCLGAGAASPKTRTQKFVSELAEKEPLRSSVWGFFAVNMAGDTLACFSSDTRMVPASNMKLITTGLALQSLGPEYRYRTGIACRGEICGGILKGDIYILGGCDPTTGARTPCAEPMQALFDRWRQMILAAGIVRIDGNIIADARAMKHYPSAGLWASEDRGLKFGAVPAGLNFNENAQIFFLAPAAVEGAAPLIRSRFPETPWMEIANFAVTAGSGCANTVAYFPSSCTPYAEFHGEYPLRGSGSTLECSNPYGAYTCAYYFYYHLCRSGLPVSGTWGDVSPNGHVRTNLHIPESGPLTAAPSELKQLGFTLSPALGDIIRDTNCESDNFYAETLYNTLRKDTSPSSLLKGMGLDPGQYVQKDGSGLSRQNIVSPSFMVRFLKAMLSSPVSAAFLQSLPHPGLRRSTLAYRMEKTDAGTRARILMKSGSMTGVRCYSGYILPSGGDRDGTIVFSLMTGNVIDASRSEAKMLDRILLTLAAEN